MSVLTISIDRTFADDSTSPSSEPATLNSEPPTEFPAGTIAFDTFGSWAVQPHGTPDQLWTYGIGGNWYFIDNLSWGWELDGMVVPQSQLNADGIGGAFTFRGHWLRGDGWSIFSDLNLGLVDFNHRVPESTSSANLGGTDFNFTLRSGIGSTIHLFDKTDLLLGVRYYHISNACTSGEHRNPSFNSTEFYTGLMFRL